MKWYLPLFVAALLVFAGCSGSATGGSDPSQTAALTAEPRAHSTLDSVAPSPQTLTVSLAGGASSSLDPTTELVLTVTANTSLPGYDASSASDPYFTVTLNGEQVVETEEMETTPVGEFSIDVPETEVRRFAGQDVTVNVTLWEGDLLVDEYVQSATKTVTFAELPETLTPTLSTQTTIASATPSTASGATQATTHTPKPASTRTPTSTQRTSWEVTVVRVIDGDTFTVRFADGHTENVRLLGVDTPEVHVENDPEEFEGIPDTPAGTAWLRDWGHKASEFARTEVADETLTIKTDPAADRRGSYGRLLVYVYHEGTDSTSFNRELIDFGYARMYDTSFSKRCAFSAAESTVQANNIGLWNYEESTATPTPTPTSTPTKDDDEESGTLAVAEVHADARGNDHENENDEYVIFENTGSAPLDLTGWTVSDEADHTYTFSGVVVDPGDTVTLYTGSGTDTNSEVYWGSNSAIWNNDGDTVIVTNDDGETVIRHSY